MYAERARGPQTFGDIMRRMTRWGANESDQGPVHLGYRLGHTRGESRVFRALVYNKAAATLHMLRRMLGDEAFFRGLRRLYDGFRFQKAGTEDVREAFQSVTERPLGRFFQRWIYGSTLPNLRFSYRLDAVTPSRVIVRVEQTSETFDLPLTVTLHFTDGTTSDTTIVVDDRVVERAIPVTKALRNVTADRDELVMGRVERASRPS
jgi:aminopeptidase N